MKVLSLTLLMTLFAISNCSKTEKAEDPGSTDSKGTNVAETNEPAATGTPEQAMLKAKLEETPIADEDISVPEDFEEEAEKQITSENLDKELEALAKEVLMNK